MKQHWKVGELAKLTGLTVRTLRYYDQIGLFSPSDHTESGHRIYNEFDLSRLQKILSLKQIGLSLKDVQSVLSSSQSYSVSKVMSIQIARLKEDIQVQQNLLNELEDISILFRNKQPLSVEDLTTLLGAMKMNQEKYFTKEQLELMKKQYENIDTVTLKKAEQDFNTVLEELRSHMQKGTPATDIKVQALAQQWSEIANSFTKNDPEIQKAAEKYHTDNPGNDLQYGVDAEIYQYIGKALQGI